MVPRKIPCFVLALLNPVDCINTVNPGYLRTRVSARLRGFIYPQGTRYDLPCAIRCLFPAIRCHSEVILQLATAGMAFPTRVNSPSS